jgi:hypothetical protein
MAYQDVKEDGEDQASRQGRESRRRRRMQNRGGKADREKSWRGLGLWRKTPDHSTLSLSAVLRYCADCADRAAC